MAGELLRTTLEGYLLKSRVSREAVVEVEYMEAVSRPEPEVLENQDDWVSAVAYGSEVGLLGGGCVVSGSYDSLLRVQALGSDGVEGKPVVGKGHSGAIKSVDVFGSLVVTGGRDHKVHLYDLDPTSPNAFVSKSGLRLPAGVAVHSDTVEAVSFHSLGMTFLTAGWDGKIRVFASALDAPEGDDGEDMDVEDEDVEGEDDEETGGRGRKRRKNVRGGRRGVQTSSSKYKPAELAPLIELSGHVGAVMTAMFERWGDGTQAVSGGMDRSIRVWDVPSGAQSRNIPTNASLLDLDLSRAASTSAVISGHADPFVRLWDFRVGGPSSLKFKGHAGFVPAVAWVPGSDTVFATGSHDSNIRIWDIRSPSMALYTLDIHTDKVLSIAWTSPTHAITGSADCTVGSFTLPE